MEKTLSEAPTTKEIIDWLRKASVSIYIAVEESVADDISHGLKKAAD